MGKLDYSIIGQRFGRLRVIDFDRINERGKSCWICECDCGNRVSITNSNLRSGNTTSCGCKELEKRAENLVGKRFGRLVVLDFDHRGADGAYVLCECDCGNQKIISAYNLKRGHITSCGCKVRDYNSEDLIGRQFGKLRVIGFDRIVRGRTYWLCECDCGNRTIVLRSNLVKGHTRSCGCMHREAIVTHGMSYDRLYEIWVSMKQRCTNSNEPSYHHYGGRGITLCREWNCFENFRDWAVNTGYRSDLTIDRIDNNDGYYPENCRWVDMLTQANNRRTCHYITYAGHTHTIAEWARLFDIRYNTLHRHISQGDMSDFEEYFGE